jgi:hypothetical protein
MAETARWPTDKDVLDAFERESEVADAERFEYELDGAGRRVAPAIDDQPGAAIPVLPARTSNTAAIVSAHDEETAARASARHVSRAGRGAATDTYQRRLANLVDHVRMRFDRLRGGNRLTVPALIAIVLVQSAWLITDRLANDTSGIIANRTTLGVEAVSDPSARATTGVQPVGREGGSGAASQAARAEKTVASNNPTGSRQRVAAVAVPAARPAAAPGSLSIAVPFQLEIYENGRFVGINGEKGVPLTSGSHRIELVNESLRYRSSHTVAITSGRTTQMKVALPTGMLHLNATPWAEVSIDGTSVGETPLANISVPIGPHLLTFRHPQLGEQTRSIVVAAESSTRIGVDLQK